MDFDERRLGLNLSNKVYSLRDDIHLLGGYDYKEYRKRWMAGFQTENEWPLVFSYDLDYKQRDDIGDARTNWELNRHYQFAILAKNYFASHDVKYLQELKTLYQDWNGKNPFLWGISWTSVMEIAIRDISWMYTLAFLMAARCEDKQLMGSMEKGIMNMTDYICKHYSRFSSANNHLIVEITAVGLAGFCFRKKEWMTLSVATLSHELYKQNYKDGVNMELSLHYQSFVMEAYGLMIHTMQHNGAKVPEEWKRMLDRMCMYVSHCLWKEKTACEFGDDDEGKILDLQGGDINHYSYVLQLCSLVLNKRYSTFEQVNETIRWLFTADEITECSELTLYDNIGSICFKEGGNSFLRDKDNQILIGIDHAALGFGSIAAHGHADALSFQLFYKGMPVFVDPGTYIYHCDLKSRNEFRQTINHNTMSVNGKDQSEMLGAFLWGKKADTVLDEWKSDEESDVLTAHHNGYAPVIHQRTFSFDKDSTFTIIDSINRTAEWVCNFNLGIGILPVVVGTDVYLEYERKRIGVMSFTSEDLDISVVDNFYSPEYGKKEKIKSIRVKGKMKNLVSLIKINKQS